MCGLRGVECLCPCEEEDLFEYGQFTFVGVGFGVCVGLGGGCTFHMVLAVMRHA